MNTLRKTLSTCLLLVAFAATAIGQTVSRVEYYWDTDPGRGHGTPITGWSAANQVNINTTISTAGLSAGIHTLGIRSRSSHGDWSAVGLHRVVVGQQVSHIEYFYDTDPGFGLGRTYATSATGNTVTIDNAQLSAAGISDGFHRLGLRARAGTNGMWSPTYWQQVLVNGKGVVQVEYFYDTVPAYGQGTQYTAFTQGTIVNIDNAQLSAAGISDGFHRLGLRAKAGGLNGLWSPVYWQNVLVNGAGVVQVEYFYDSVPAFGQGMQYTAFTQGATVTIDNAQLSAAGISDGFHRLGIRAKAGGLNGLWSPVYWQQVLVNGKGVVQVEYFYDSVPAFGQGMQYTAFTQGATVTIDNAQLSAAGISDGFHRLGLRAKAGGLNGLWSPVYWQNVLVNGAGITQVEYYWDEAHPAPGAATPLTGFTPGSMVTVNAAQLSTAGLTTGVHRLALRARSGNGLWSPTYFHEVFVGGAADYAEYYWDTDPGYGQATPIAFTPGEVVTVNISNIAVPTSDGLHTLAIRARAGKTWSPTYIKTYCNAPTPMFSLIGSDTVCQGEQIIILDETEGASAQTQYSWDMQSDGTVDDQTAGDLTYTYAQPGTYELTLGVGNDATCQNTYSKTVVVRSTQNPSISISRDRNNVCEGEEVRFVATLQRAAEYNPQIEWYRNDTLMAGLTADTIYLSDLRNDDRIRAKVRVNNPCAPADSAQSSQLTMRIYSLPQVTMQHRRFVFTDEQAFTLASRFAGTPTGGTYSINGTTTTLFNPSRNSNGIYTISYTYTNNNGCSTTVLDSFELRERVEYMLTAQSVDPLQGSVSGSGLYTIGDTATATAIAATSWKFDHWNDGDTTNPRRIEMMANTTLTAYWQRLCRDTVIVDSADVCDSYEWHGTTYTSSTTEATYTVPSALGCDSTHQLHLFVRHSNAGTETVVACDSYQWHGELYLTSNNTATYQNTNAAGCDSVTTLHLTINHSNEGTETITACDSYLWHGTTYTASTNTPTHTTDNVAGCDSVTTLHLTINHSNAATLTVTACDSYQWHGTTYTASTNTPTNTTDNVVGCDSVTTLHLTINHSNSAIETVTACNSFVWHGTEYTASTDTPTYTTENVAGCDSVTTLHLTINHCSTTDITACDSYTWHGTTYTTSGIYSHGTDTLVLTVNYSNSAIETVTACNSFMWHGTTYTTSTNTPTYMTSNVAGCDSVTTLHLTINHCSTTDITACDSYTWHGTTYTTSGIYSDGNDTLVLTVKYSNSAVENVTACDSYLWHGTTYTASTNMPTYTTDNVAGCDSVTTLHLTVNHSNSAIETVTACNSFVWHGTEYIASTDTPTYTTDNVAGCDSVTTLHLTINHCSTTDITACDSYTWHGTTYTTSGIYTYGTDTLVLTVNYSNSAIETVTACNSFMWHGTTYTSSTNTPTYTTSNVAGCDSTTTLHLTITHCSSLDTTVCDSCTWHGVTYTSSGIYIQGTDSLILTVNYSNTTTETITACDYYTWHGVLYTTNTNTPQYHTTNIHGCDSTVTLHLTIQSSFTITFVANGGSGTMASQSACPAEPTTLNACTFTRTGYQFAGWAVTASGSVMFADEAEVTLGSDLTLYAIWTVACSDQYATSSYSTCGSYTWRGRQLTASGTYNDTVTGAVNGGCDSIYTLTFTLLPQFTISFSAAGGTGSMNDITACSGESVILPTNTFIREGYTFSGWATSSNGGVVYPDGATIVLSSSLTLYAVWVSNCVDAYSTNQQVTCNSMVWRNSTYTESGTYRDTVEDAVAGGCDSVYVLYLTVNQSSSATETVEACDSYQWHGTTYTESSEGATVVLTNSVGCDSTVTLHLTIHPSVYQTIDSTVDESLTWNGTTYTESGTYTWTGTTAYGCDSVVVLHLTVLNHQGIETVTMPKVAIYPNPTIGEVRIEATGLIHVAVYDTYGRRIPIEEDSTLINLNAYPSGAYTFRVTTVDGVYIGKVIKK